MHASDVRRWLEENKHLFPLGASQDEEGQLMPIMEDFGDFFVIFDGYWTRFRSKKSSWKDRCRFEEVMELPRLPECTRDCWKLLMFRRKSEEIWTGTSDLLQELRISPPLSAHIHKSTPTLREQ